MLCTVVANRRRRSASVAAITPMTQSQVCILYKTNTINVCAWRYVWARLFIKQNKKNIPAIFFHFQNFQYIISAIILMLKWKKYFYQLRIYLACQFCKLEITPNIILISNPYSSHFWCSPALFLNHNVKRLNFHRII